MTIKEIIRNLENKNKILSSENNKMKHEILILKQENRKLKESNKSVNNIEHVIENTDNEIYINKSRRNRKKNVEEISEKEVVSENIEEVVEEKE